jgi:hypothetical protein
MGEGHAVNTATATSYKGTFHGRADQLSLVRRNVARHFSDVPIVDDLVLVASELAGNAVLHSQSRGDFFAVRAEMLPGCVRIEVEDLGGPWRPRKGDGERPHGLDLIEALAGGRDNWGTLVTDEGNRIVWAKLAW